MDKQSLYLQTITEAYPDLDIRTARLHTGDGQFSDVLLINDDLIFRFPRYEQNIDDFLREIKILHNLQGYLSLPIPQPIYISTGTRVIGKVFMGYELLPGKPFFREELESITSESLLESFARQLANFLYGLHHLSPAMIELDLSVPDQLAQYQQFFSDIREHLFPSMRPEARDTVTGHFEDYFRRPNFHEYEPSIIHGDFGGSNILFEEETITGIIDFSFAGLGDSARDIAAVSTYGEAFFARICRYYPDVESLLERAKFYRGTFALQEALHGFRNNDKEALASAMEEYV